MSHNGPVNLDPLNLCIRDEVLIVGQGRLEIHHTTKAHVLFFGTAQNQKVSSYKETNFPCNYQFTILCEVNHGGNDVYKFHFLFCCSDEYVLQLSLSAANIGGGDTLHNEFCAYTRWV